MFTFIKCYKNNLRRPSDQTDFCNVWHLRGILHEAVAMITNMDFNSYTYCPFQYEVDELLSLLEQQTQELINMKRASGHSSTAARERHVADSCYFKSSFWATWRWNLDIFQKNTLWPANMLQFWILPKNLNDTWASLTGDSKVCLQTQENHQRNLKGYCPSVQESKGEIGCNLLEWC